MHDLSEKRDTTDRTQGTRGGRIEHTEKMRGWIGYECRCEGKKGERDSLKDERRTVGRCYMVFCPEICWGRRLAKSSFHEMLKFFVFHVFQIVNHFH
jgi:hypothetical protein